METPHPTRTPAPPLPETSAVTLVPATGPGADGWFTDGLYVADASTGDTFSVETAPGPILEPRAWVSPTQLVVEGRGPDLSLYLLDLSDKTLRRLPASANDAGVSFSHSGGLMTTVTTAGELVISSVADSREVARIPTGPPSYYVLWAPDDKHIYLEGAPGGIASVGPKPTVVAVDWAAGDSDGSWFADGSRVAFGNAHGIFSIDAHSGEQALLYSWPTGTTANPTFLKLSPDSKYALALGPEPFVTVVVPLTGGTQGIQITGIDADHTDSSPVEDVVAVIADWCKPEARLLLVNPDGSIHATVVSQPDIQVPRFSADGSLIAYVGRGPQEKGMQDQGGITVRKAEGGDNLVSFIAGFYGTESWSPDGRWLAYSPTLLSYQCTDSLGKTQILPFP